MAELDHEEEMKKSTITLPVRGDKVFLARKKRGFGEGFLNGYGGKPQEGDISIKHTAAREMKEEGGVTASPESLEEVAIIRFYEEERPVFECHVFFCREWQGQFQETEEMDAPQGYPVSDPPYDRMWDADRAWLPLIFSGAKIRATSRYNKGMTKQESFEYEPL